MRFSLIVLVFLFFLFSLSPPSMAQGHVNLIMSEVPFGGDVKKFCENGYKRHNWMPVIPQAGTWTVINPKKRVNFRYIPSYMQRCRSGGMVPSTM